MDSGKIRNMAGNAFILAGVISVLVYFANYSGFTGSLGKIVACFVIAALSFVIAYVLKRGAVPPQTSPAEPKPPADKKKAPVKSVPQNSDPEKSPPAKPAKDPEEDEE